MPQAKKKKESENKGHKYSNFTEGRTRIEFAY